MEIMECNASQLRGFGFSRRFTDRIINTEVRLFVEEDNACTYMHVGIYIYIYVGVRAYECMRVLVTSCQTLTLTLTPTSHSNF